MPAATEVGTVARIRALSRAGHREDDIAWRTGVSRRTVRRYIDPSLRYWEIAVASASSRRSSPNKDCNPLYDPRRDGTAPLSLTGEVCGDPQPGRREMVARGMRTGRPGQP